MVTRTQTPNYRHGRGCTRQAESAFALGTSGRVVATGTPFQNARCIASIMAFRHPVSGRAALRWLPHPAVQLSNRDPQQLGSLRLGDCPLRQGAQAQPLESPGLLTLPDRERFLTGRITPTAALEFVEQAPEEGLAEYAQNMPRSLQR